MPESMDDDMQPPVPDMTLAGKQSLQHPQLPFKTPQKKSTGDHTALKVHWGGPAVWVRSLRYNCPNGAIMHDIFPRA